MKGRTLFALLTYVPGSQPRAVFLEAHAWLASVNATLLDCGLPPLVWRRIPRDPERLIDTIGITTALLLGLAARSRGCTPEEAAAVLHEHLPTGLGF